MAMAKEEKLITGFSLHMFMEHTASTQMFMNVGEHIRIREKSSNRPFSRQVSLHT